MVGLDPTIQRNRKFEVWVVGSSPTEGGGGGHSVNISYENFTPVGEVGMGEGLEYCLLFHGPHIQRREQRSHGGFGGAACTIVTLQRYSDIRVGNAAAIDAFSSGFYKHARQEFQ